MVIRPEGKGCPLIKFLQVDLLIFGAIADNNKLRIFVFIERQINFLFGRLAGCVDRIIQQNGQHPNGINLVQRLG